MHVEGTSSTFISTPNPHSHFQTALTFEIIELEGEVVDSETISVLHNFQIVQIMQVHCIGTEDSYLTAREIFNQGMKDGIGGGQHSVISTKPPHFI